MIRTFKPDIFKPHSFVKDHPIFKYSSYIYLKNEKKIYLILPKYHNCLPDEIAKEIYKKPIIHINSKLCKKISSFSSEFQNAFVWEITLEMEDLQDEQLVDLDGKYYLFYNYENFIKNSQITACTLFFTDFKNSRLYIDYYYEDHGIKNFWLYYNGEISKIEEFINSLKIPEEVSVVIFSLDLPYWQNFCGKREHIVNLWPHSAQSIQLSHSSILANYYSEYLLSVDLDEYVSMDINLSKFLSENPEIKFIWLGYKNVTCNGNLCSRDYDYDKNYIFKNLNKDSFDKNYNGKFLEKTKGLRRFLRKIHMSNYENSKALSANEIKYIDLIHVKCLSFKFENILVKRICERGKRKNNIKILIY